jgi:NADH pyrophosphatase NudC (nudix superfamily)
MMNDIYQHCPTCKSALKINAEGYLECSSKSCKYMYYNNPTPVVAAIVEYKENHVVLAHNKLWPPKWFGLITGFVEEYENPNDTVIREVKEELGLDAQIENFVGHYTFKRMNQLIIAYHVSAIGEIQLNDELDDYRIVPFHKVKTWPAGTGKALKDFLERRGFQPEILQFP